MVPVIGAVELRVHRGDGCAAERHPIGEEGGEPRRRRGPGREESGHRSASGEGVGAGDEVLCGASGIGARAQVLEQRRRAVVARADGDEAAGRLGDPERTELRHHSDLPAV